MIEFFDQRLLTAHTRHYSVIRRILFLVRRYIFNFIHHF